MCFLHPRAPGVDPFLVDAAGADAARNVDAINSGSVHLG